MYCNFNDSNSRNWTIMFAKHEECVKFASFIAVAKTLSDPSRPLVVQDIKPGKGNVRPPHSLTARALAMLELCW